MKRCRGARREGLDRGLEASCPARGRRPDGQAASCSSSRRSRMPVMGLVRLRWALGAGMPLSTRSTTRGPRPGGLRRPRAGRPPSLGDADTGLLATGPALPCGRGGASPPWGRPETVEPVPGTWASALAGNPGEPRSRRVGAAALAGATRPGRCTAQASNGARRGCCQGSRSQWRAGENARAGRSHTAAVSKGAALEPRAPQTGLRAREGLTLAADHEALAIRSRTRTHG